MTTLEKLLKVRAAHVDAAQAHLTRAQAELAAVDQELATIDAELHEIEEQRDAWEREWQNWLRGDGVLQHGQDYNLYHIKLTAWEDDAQERRKEVQLRHQIATGRVMDARAAVLDAQRRYQVIAKEAAAVARALQQKHASIVSSNALDDLTAHRWSQRDTVQ